MGKLVDRQRENLPSKLCWKCRSISTSHHRRIFFVCIRKCEPRPDETSFLLSFRFPFRGRSIAHTKRASLFASRFLLFSVPPRLPIARCSMSAATFPILSYLRFDHVANCQTNRSPRSPRCCSSSNVDWTKDAQGQRQVVWIIGQASSQGSWWRSRKSKIPLKFRIPRFSGLTKLFLYSSSQLVFHPPYNGIACGIGLFVAFCAGYGTMGFGMAHQMYKQGYWK